MQDKIVLYRRSYLYFYRSTLFLLAFDMDGAAMFEDNLTTETKTDASTSGLGGVEGDKSVLQYVGWHTTSVVADADRSEEHTSELQSRCEIAYAVFCV